MEKFVRIHKDSLFTYLFYNQLFDNDIYPDLLSLRQCNHRLKELLDIKFAQSTEFTLSKINRWSNKQKSKYFVHISRLYIDCQNIRNTNLILPKLRELRFFNFGWEFPINLIKTEMTNLQWLSLGRGFNHPLTENMFPPNLIGLSFSNGLTNSSSFNQPLLPKSLPSKLKVLLLGSAYNQPLLPDVLPTGLKILIFGGQFNKEISDNILPKSLVLLEFGNIFNQKINANVLPDNLRIIEFGSRYNQPFNINILPANLQELYLERNFDQPLKPYILPNSLEILEFGEINSFNQPLKIGSLPPNLKTLNFGLHGAFNQPLDIDVIPSNLTKLSFGMLFNQKIKPGTLPDSILHLTMGTHFKQSLNTSQSFTGMLFKKSPSENRILPKYLVSLNLDGVWDYPIDPGILPETLQKLTFGYVFNQSLKFGSLPRNLTHLSFGLRFNKSLDKCLPLNYCGSLTSLELYENYNKKLSAHLLKIVKKKYI